MSDTCTVEIGLLKKHACGAPAATKCANCEQPLCAKHAAPKMSEGKKLFLCPECAKAWKQIGDIPEPAPAAAAPAEKKPAAAPPKPAPAPKPESVPKPVPVAPKPAPEEKKPQPAAEHSGALEFTPGKPAAPEKKPEPAPAPAAAPKAPAAPPAGGKFELSIEQSAPPEPKPEDKK